MDKRLEKRHKRQVTRARLKVKTSEPDVRTQEQIEAARAASQAKVSHGDSPKVAGSSTSFRSNRAMSSGSSAKTDA